MVVVKLPGAAVERVAHPDQRRIVQSFIPQETTHVGPVLLFHMRVIVLVVRPRASELHGSFAIAEVAP